MTAKKQEHNKKEIFSSAYSTYPANKQKRKKARIAVDIEGLLEISGHPASDCRITSLGPGGMTLVVRTTVYLGDLVNIRFVVGMSQLNIECEVVRTTGKEVGLKFRLLSDEDEQKIQSLIYKDAFSRPIK